MAPCPRKGLGRLRKRRACITGRRLQPRLLRGIRRVGSPDFILTGLSHQPAQMGSGTRAGFAGGTMRSKPGPGRKKQSRCKIASRRRNRIQGALLIQFRKHRGGAPGGRRERVHLSPYPPAGLTSPGLARKFAPSAAGPKHGGIGISLIY